MCKGGCSTQYTKAKEREREKCKSHFAALPYAWVLSLQRQNAAVNLPTARSEYVYYKRCIGLESCLLACLSSPWPLSLSWLYVFIYRRVRASEQCSYKTHTPLGSRGAAAGVMIQFCMKNAFSVIKNSLACGGGGRSPVDCARVSNWRKRRPPFAGARWMDSVCVWLLEIFCPHPPRRAFLLACPPDRHPALPALPKETFTDRNMLS